MQKTKKNYWAPDVSTCLMSAECPILQDSGNVTSPFEDGGMISGDWGDLTE